MVALPDEPLTIEQFLLIRPELPEGGQWSELRSGLVTTFQAPDSDYGLVVSHLTKKLSGLFQVGTPIFRPLLRVDAKADTLQMPAVAYFAAPGRFDLIDAEWTADVPSWVIEIASTGDRRRIVQERANAYLAMGVQLLWIIDPRERTLVTLKDGKQRQHGESATVSAAPVVDLDFPLGDLFVEPEWWAGRA